MDKQYSERVEMLLIEECPLQPEYKQYFPTNSNRNGWRASTQSNLKGPLRVLRLCLLAIILPVALIAGPLYARYHLYSGQIYPLAMSDMRLIDNKMSTTWCQRQHVKVNTTFNAFLLAETPKMIREPKILTMIRELKLKDDMKEYWGFYLLRDSTVTVSTCTRWPGSSLTIIRGHKHLHECAYIGDDSSEEIDELMEQIRESNTDETIINKPIQMKRHRADVKFHDPVHQSNKNNTNHTLDQPISNIDDHDELDKKQLVQLLQQLSERTKVRKKTNNNTNDIFKKWDDHIHKYRNQSVNQNELLNLRFANNAEQRTNTTHRVQNVSNVVNNATSEEIFQLALNLIEQRGARGQSILKRLIVKYNLTETPIDDSGVDLKQILLNNTVTRTKRDILVQELNQNDEEKDAAYEEGLTPDGIADHHQIINETNLNDRSNSEYWSSFSSSEEALLNCAGLILNLPLTPATTCDITKPNHIALGLASLPNTVTYTVPSNGYYFFVFNSENEKQENYLRIQFDLHKTVYNVSNSVAKCANSTVECALNLQFFSNEKLVLELPVMGNTNINNSLWNQEFVVISECEPRTSIYVICVIAVPLVILLFAFQ